MGVAGRDLGLLVRQNTLRDAIHRNSWSKGLWGLGCQQQEEAKRQFSRYNQPDLSLLGICSTATPRVGHEACSLMLHLTLAKPEYASFCKRLVFLCPAGVENPHRCSTGVQNPHSHLGSHAKRCSTGIQTPHECWEVLSRGSEPP